MTVKDILKVSKFDVIIRDRANLAGICVRITNRDNSHNYEMISALVLNADIDYLEGYSDGTLIIFVNLHDEYEKYEKEEGSL